MIHTQYQQPYSEIDGLIVLRRYKVQNAGCCKVCSVRFRVSCDLYAGMTHMHAIACCRDSRTATLQVVLHPKWGSSVYPASLFAKAPLIALQQAIMAANVLLRDGKLFFYSD